MPSFHEIRFPEKIKYGSLGGPKFMTDVQATDSGNEQRIGRWAVARQKYQVGTDANQEQYKELLSFFYARRGRLYGFRFKDWLDYRDDGRGILISLGGNQYQLAKNYNDIAGSYVRKIYKPVDGTITILRNGIAYGSASTDPATGIVTVTGSPSGTLTWTGQFDVPVRFDSDEINTSIADFDSRTWDGMPLIELLLEN